MIIISNATNYAYLCMKHFKFNIMRNVYFLLLVIPFICISCGSGKNIKNTNSLSLAGTEWEYATKGIRSSNGLVNQLKFDDNSTGTISFKNPDAAPTSRAFTYKSDGLKVLIYTGGAWGKSPVFEVTIKSNDVIVLKDVSDETGNRQFVRVNKKK